MDVQCPICEFVLDPWTGPEGPRTGLVEALGLTGGITSAEADHIALGMAEHLEQHTVIEWVLAMRQADAYIDKLEQGLDSARGVHVQLEADKAELERRLSDEVNRRHQSMPANQGWTQGAPPGFAEDMFSDSSPRTRQEQLAEDRRAGRVKPFSDTLIPIIRGERPEGAVGRKS